MPAEPTTDLETSMKTARYLRTSCTILFVALLSLASSAMAERATSEEMDQVAHNWMTMVVNDNGGWSLNNTPEISDVQDIVVDGVLLGKCYSISPQGYIVVPTLKALAPVKASSEDYQLDVNDEDGFAALLRELFVDANKSFESHYGSLDAAQSRDADDPFGSEYRNLWDRYSLSTSEFSTYLGQRDRDTTVSVGPLMSVHWAQGDPYRDFCPIGDGGTCLVGCVATAVAQILQYHQWPPYGDNEPKYYWTGDESCNSSTSGAWLRADVQDNYDWANMADYVGVNYPLEQRNAVAELCYEVAVAFRMHFGRCASGAYVTTGAYALPTYFRFKDSIVTTPRSGQTKPDWVARVQQDIDEGLPISYRITTHAIVLDGYRVVDGIDQMHFNYGWNTPHTTWYTVDYLHCDWEGCTVADQLMLTRIIPDKTIYFLVDTTFGFLPLSVEVEGASELEVDEWSFSFGDGDSAYTRSASHTYTEAGNYDVSMMIETADSTYTFMRQSLVYAIADSIIAPSVIIPPDSVAEVVIYARNSVPLDKIELPVDYDNGDFDVILDSFSTAGCRTENVYDFTQAHWWPGHQTTFRFTCSEPDLSNKLAPGFGPILKLYFSAAPGVQINQTVELDLSGYSNYSAEYESSLIDFQPVLINGELAYGGCCDGFRGNIDGDPADEIDIGDLIALVDFMFNEGPEPACITEANIDGFGDIDVSDLIMLVTYMFQDGPPPANCPH